MYFDELLMKNLPHIFENIFLSLDFESLKVCSKVCNAWNELLSSESFLQEKTQLLQGNKIKLNIAIREGNPDEV